MKVSAGSVNSYVYRLKYRRAETIAMAIMALYSGNPLALMAHGGRCANQHDAAGMGVADGMGGWRRHGRRVRRRQWATDGGGVWAAALAAWGLWRGGMARVATARMGVARWRKRPVATANRRGDARRSARTAPRPEGAADLTGSYLGNGADSGTGPPHMPHVIPNPFDNTVLIQGTPQDYEQISSLMGQLDVPPRQVLIDAKIYEVDLTGSSRGRGRPTWRRKIHGGLSRTLTAATGDRADVALTTGALVLHSHELLAAITASETSSGTQVISAPSIIATDSVGATMNVGSQVPV